MDNKVVLVTGSSSGIGEATLMEFAKLGCRLVVHGTNSERIKGVQDKCLKLTGRKPLSVKADLCNEDDVQRLLTETIQFYGQLDVLVNNAGLFTPANAIDGMEAFKVYQKMIKINLDQAVLLTLLSAPYLKKTKGCVVNISSNLHFVCISGSFAYSAAKAALTMFTKSVAVDLAPDVRVNSVSPGPVATRMPSRSGQDLDSFKKSVGSSCLVERVGEPDEIARMVVYLCRPESAFITGSDFVVDGGGSIKPAGKVMGQD